LLRPFRERLQCCVQPPPVRREAIAALLVLDEADLAQLLQARVQQRGVGVARVLQRAERERLAAQLPQDAQRGAAPEQVERDHDRAAGPGAANRSA